MTKYFSHNEHEFEILEAYDAIPDTKYKYVYCSFYKKGVNQKFYIRADSHLFKHKVMRCDKVNGFVSVKEVQRHPVHERLIHADFFILDSDASNTRMRLPLKYMHLDKSPGIKLGGFLNITSRDLPIKLSSVKELVPYIKVDLTGYAQEQSIRLKDVVFSSGIVPIRNDLTIATVMPSKGGEG